MPMLEIWIGSKLLFFFFKLRYFSRAEKRPWKTDYFDFHGAPSSNNRSLGPTILESILRWFTNFNCEVACSCRVLSYLFSCVVCFYLSIFLSFPTSFIIIKNNFCFEFCSIYFLFLLYMYSFMSLNLCVLFAYFFLSSFLVFVYITICWLVYVPTHLYARKPAWLVECPLQWTLRGHLEKKSGTKPIAGVHTHTHTHAHAHTHTHTHTHRGLSSELTAGMRCSKASPLRLPTARPMNSPMERR